MADRRDLPPLTHLIPFEAAGRLGSMSAAARALGISQPAVSRHLALLEADLGVVLFMRTRRGLTLTDTGRDYWNAVSRGMDEIARATSVLRDRTSDRPIRIAAHFGFAQHWLMPRLPALRTAIPDLSLRLITGDRDADIDLAECDLAIRFGDGDWAACHAVKLWDETVFALCAPDYLARHPHLGDPDLTAQDLANADLLHMDELSERWLTWSSWFALQGVVLNRTRATFLYPTYPLLLQAALGGQGVVLGWSGLVDELVQEGRLIRLPLTVRRASHGYFLCRPVERRGHGRVVDQVADWLLHEAAMS
jgi:DNA-binding transcriptional LysR family regulator